MSRRYVSVHRPGLFSTVQDTGRSGYARFGMPASGAMDRMALAYGNAVLGNAASLAALECTVLGPTLCFEHAAWFSLSGGAVKACLNDRPIPMWQAVRAAPKSVLHIGSFEQGCRAYLCVDGGFDVPLVMKSRSTYVSAGIGGIEGRALRADDRLPLGRRASPPGALLGDRVVPRPSGWTPPRYSNHSLRVLMGPQHEMFSDRAKKLFLGAHYELSPDANRMGFRLAGPRLEHLHRADIVSDGISFGAIQVPGHGEPIILMADRQTTGGYAKIASVISTDLPSAAQMSPGQKFGFQKVDIEHAHELSQNAAHKFRDYKDMLSNLAEQRLKRARQFRAHVSGKVYDVLVEPK